jgi:CRP/FNR family transcriptional regulator
MNCTKCENTRCFIKNNCTEDWLSYVQNNKTVHNKLGGKKIFHEGEVVKGMYVVCRGKLKVLLKGDSTKEKIVRLAGEGQVLGHRGFCEEMVYPVSAKTITESELAFIPGDEFIKLLRKNNDLSFHMIMFYASELLHSDKKLRLQNSNSSTEKVKFALEMILYVFGYKDKKKKIIDLGLNINDLANFAGVSEPVLKRVLDELNEQELISIKGAEISVKNEAAFRDAVMVRESA